VIDIQSYKAEKLGIDLKVEYLNIDDEKEGSYSSDIVSDMVRI
jgi:hypothetical protein